MVDLYRSTRMRYWVFVAQQAYLAKGASQPKDGYSVRSLGSHYRKTLHSSCRCGTHLGVVVVVPLRHIQPRERGYAMFKKI